MAKVAFVQNLAFEYMGFMCLSAALKGQSHEVEVFLADEGGQFIEDIAAYDPDIVGFSCITGSHEWCVKIALRLKKVTGARIVFGGPHPTFFPDIIKEEVVDVVCIGEGEGAILDLANDVLKGSGNTNVLNCWFRKNGNIVKNGVRRLIDDLDSLPYPDRSLYAKKYPFLKTRQKVIFTGRGCPFDCTYCFNKKLRTIYDGKGAYVRKRSVENVIKEIEFIKNTEDPAVIYFQDDTFVLDKKWLKDFSVEYERRVGIPYICLLRVELIDEEVADMLKSSSCVRVFFGVESGSEELRFKLLNRRVTDDRIINGAAVLKKRGIRFRTYNMLGLPGETLEDAFKTVEINNRIGTDYPWCSLFYPYPGTELEHLAESKGLISTESRRDYSSFFKKSIIVSDHAGQLENLQKLFFYCVKFPFLKNAIKSIIRLKPNIVFELLFLVSYGWCYKNSECITLGEAFGRGMRNLPKLFLRPSMGDRSI
jgi:radical SAM superfamily enzyme YgiQ (UPF0313 family)